MKGFIEVNVTFKGGSLLALININTIESVARCDDGRAIIYSNVTESNGDIVEQIKFTAQNTYEEVKAMIEEAMK